jgi:hypothetical protein
MSKARDWNILLTTITITWLIIITVINQNQLVRRVMKKVTVDGGDLITVKSTKNHNCCFNNIPTDWRSIRTFGEIIGNGG